MVGHLAENGLVVYEEFRQGNVTPSAKNLEFIKQCEKQMAKGKRIGYLRADAASYQKVRSYAYSIFKEIRYKIWIFCCKPL